MSNFRDKLMMVRNGSGVGNELFLAMAQHAHVAINKATRSMVYIVLLIVLIELTSRGIIKEINLLAVKIESPYFVQSISLLLISYYAPRALFLFNYHAIASHYLEEYAKKLPDGCYASGAAAFLMCPNILSAATASSIISSSPKLKTSTEACHNAIIGLVPLSLVFVAYKAFRIGESYLVAASYDPILFAESYSMFIAASVVCLLSIAYSLQHFYITMNVGLKELNMTSSKNDK